MQEKNTYQKSLELVKNSLSRVAAVTVFLMGSALLFVLIGKIMHDLLKIQGVYSSWLPLISVIAVALFVLSPLEFGMRRWYYALCSGREKPLYELFYYFKDRRLYGKLLCFRLVMCVTCALGYGVALTPAIGLSLLQRGIAPYQFTNGFGVIVYELVSVLYLIAVIAGIAVGFYFNLRYFLAWCLLVEYPELPLRRMFTCSVQQMSSKKREAGGLYLSLFPFWLTCIFIVPMLWMIPYTYVASAVKGFAFLHPSDAKR